MGVPAFYRWLSEKYPKIVHDMLEKRKPIVDGVEMPLNLTEPNPNGLEYDNLYVDMNGLIHPCSHPEDRDAPTTEAEMYVNVTKYVDRLFAAVRPRRILFMAIDGVAPRAKMNQQRSRRFRAASDAKERRKMLEEVLAEMEELGLSVDGGKGGPEWDSNVITPGTEFMYNLSLYLRFYVLDRMNRDPAWRSIQVIISDASEPGEGEHKIMKFIRSQRAQPGYDPNQRHILHGLDADLIMLALATHEPHFTILRELVTFGKRDRDKPSKSEAQQLLDAQSGREAAAASAVNPQDEWVFAKPLQALHINILREYLEGEFRCLDGFLPFQYDLERIIDDFVFLCFFVGNDFLPHLPSLDIRDGALDFLIECYKELLGSMGDYLTTPGGNVNLQQADIILARVGEIEDLVFQRRKEAEDEQLRRRTHNTKNTSHAAQNVSSSASAQISSSRSAAAAEETLILRHGIAPKANLVPLGKQSSTFASSRKAGGGVAGGGVAGTHSVADNLAVADRLRGSLLGKRPARDNCDGAEAAVVERLVDFTSLAPAADAVTLQSSIKIEMGVQVEVSREDPATIPAEDPAVGEPEQEEEADVVEDEEFDCAPLAAIPNARVSAMSAGDIAKSKEEIKRRLKLREEEELNKLRNTVSDAVRLHEQGWKERYYGDPPKRDDLVQGGGLQRMCVTYVQGLVWVLKYYYEGCQSWNWYYPFHYAPFASDLRNIDRYEISFEQAAPFEPVQQLLAVLPVESSHALPECCQWLMTSEKSPIRDLYTADAPIDPNGKHLPWLWVLLLPFIEEKRVVNAFAGCKDSMTLEDCRRNAAGGTILFVHKDHEIAREAVRRGFKYSAAQEMDPAVLAAVEREKKGLISTENDTISTTVIGDDIEMTSSGESDSNSGLAVSHLELYDEPSWCADKRSCCRFANGVFYPTDIGGGTCGLIACAPIKWFARLDGTVPAPARPIAAFLDILRNNIMSVSYEYPPEKAYESRLIDGFEPLERTLNDFDLLPRRPPRLNKAKFSLLELSRSAQQQQQQGNRGPQGPQARFAQYARGGSGHNYHDNSQQQHPSGAGYRPGGSALQSYSHREIGLGQQYHYNNNYNNNLQSHPRQSAASRPHINIPGYGFEMALQPGQRTVFRGNEQQPRPLNDRRVEYAHQPQYPPQPQYQHQYQPQPHTQRPPQWGASAHASYVHPGQSLVPQQQQFLGYSRAIPGGGGYNGSAYGRAPHPASHASSPEPAPEYGQQQSFTGSARPAYPPQLSMSSMSVGGYTHSAPRPAHQYQQAPHQPGRYSAQGNPSFIPGAQGASQVQAQAPSTLQSMRAQLAQTIQEQQRKVQGGERRY